MERDSILFYRSFYEAIQGLSKDIQLEVYTAVMEYGLNGVIPDDLKPVAKGMFALMKPVLDSNNSRFENGKKGAAYGKRGGRPRKTQSDATSSDYTLIFEQEIEQMKTDAEWTASVCEEYHLTSDVYADRLKRFLKHCKDGRKKKPHDSFDDAKSHFRYWMDKAYPSDTHTAAAINTAPLVSAATIAKMETGSDPEPPHNGVGSYEAYCRAVGVDPAVPAAELARRMARDNNRPSTNRTKNNPDL